MAASLATKISKRDLSIAYGPISYLGHHPAQQNACRTARAFYNTIIYCQSIDAKLSDLPRRDSSW